MKIIDGKDAVLGRVASFAAKEALKGEKIVIVNCEEMLISGNKSYHQEDFKAKRRRVGFTQTGPKISRMPYKIVKRVIRGMLPNARRGGRGRDALKRIMCYSGVPEEYELTEKIEIGKGFKGKGIKVKELGK